MTIKIKLSLIILISLILLNSCGVPKYSVNANFKVNECEITFNNNSKIAGKLPYPLNYGEKEVKIEINGKKEKFKKSEISNIIFKSSNGDIEYVSMKVFNISGNKIKKNKILMHKSINGKVSLYHVEGSGYMQQGNTQTPIFYIHFYCKRENEPAATLIHIDINNSHGNSVFKNLAKKYFADDTEISKKIENKEYTYKNLTEVVNLYNSK